MNRTSIYLESDTLKALKLLAAASGTSVADKIREAVDMMLQRIEAHSGNYARLSHGTPNLLLNSPSTLYESVRARKHRPHRCSKPLGEVDPA